jgi:hypothetical protein
VVAVNAAKQRANAAEAIQVKMADRLTAYVLRGADTLSENSAGGGEVGILPTSMARDA